jgi:hypothetical protein
MATIEVIEVNKIDDYLRYERLKTELLIELTIFKEMTEIKLKKLKRIKTVCEQMRLIQQTRGIKEKDLDLKKEIMKHVRWS